MKSFQTWISWIDDKKASQITSHAKGFCTFSTYFQLIAAINTYLRDSNRQIADFYMKKKTRNLQIFLPQKLDFSGYIILVNPSDVIKTRLQLWSPNGSIGPATLSPFDRRDAD